MALGRVHCSATPYTRDPTGTSAPWIRSPKPTIVARAPRWCGSRRRSWWTYSPMPVFPLILRSNPTRSTGRGSVRVRMMEDFQRGPEHDFHVEPRRPVFNVEQVIAGAFIHGGVA